MEETGAANLMLMDNDGRAVAATDRNRLGTNHRTEPFFLDALRTNGTSFTVTPREAGGFSFTYSRKITAAVTFWA